MLTQERLKELVNYDPETGIFTNKVGRPNSNPGAIIGTISTGGYLVMTVDEKRYQCHRLAFLYMEGYLPEHDVDHRKGIKVDNRWSEIRHVTRSCNQQNCGMLKNNISGFKGVSWDNNRSKWSAAIWVHGKEYKLGRHDSKLEAALTRLTFELECPLWKCDERSELMKAIKKEWDDFPLIKR